MKKLFTLIAAAFMAVSVNAQTYNFAGLTKDNFNYDATEWEYKEANNGFDYLKPGTECSISLKDMPISFSYKHSTDKKSKMLLIGEKTLTSGGGKFHLQISGLKVGDQITINVGSKGSKAAVFAVENNSADADSNNPTLKTKPTDGDIEFVDLKFKANAETVALIDNGGGFAIQSVTISSNGTTAVENITIKNAPASNEVYNLAGQKVASNFKGIVIKNGKKMIQK